MRRVLAFVASDYQQDRIWMRRRKKTKRDYRIVVACDNSRSMMEARVARKALEALSTLCNAFSLLQVRSPRSARGGAAFLHSPLVWLVRVSRVLKSAVRPETRMAPGIPSATLAQPAACNLAAARPRHLAGAPLEKVAGAVAARVFP